VIFIDELDAIGARRGAGLNEERDQTLNQMLVEMDGFNKPRGVLVLAATNRAEALDPALLRPGRLTRRVFVGPPDYAGRTQILAVHLRGVETSETLATTCDAVARVTGGFTGAELANVVNEGVLLAARDDREVVTVDDLFSGAERTKNGVGVGQGAAAVLSGLRKLMQGGDPREVLKEVRDGSDRNGGGPPGGGGGFGGGPGSNDPSNISEENRRQGVGMSMPPT
jgi:cell division protease FtsH